MKGILIRDAILLYKKYLRKPFFVIAILSLIFTLLMGFPVSGLMSLVLPMGMGALATNLFAEDEKDNWLKYVKTMPISVIKIVGTRYVIFFSTVVFCVVYSLFLNLLAFFLYREQALSLYFIFMIIGFTVSVLNNLLLLPACYKFGVNGANVISLGIMMVIGAITYGIKRINLEYWINIFETIPQHIFWVIVVITFLVLGIVSLKLSIFFFNKKDIY